MAKTKNDMSGLLTKKQIEEAEYKQLQGEGFDGGFANPLTVAEHGAADILGVPSAIVEHLSDLTGVHTPPATPAQPAAKKAAKQKALPSPSQAVKDQTQSPYEQLANALATQYLTQINQLQSGIADASVTGLTNEAMGGSQAQLLQLLGAVGLSPTSTASKATTAPLTQTDPLQPQVNAATQGLSNAENSTAVDYAKAIKDTGVANTQTLESAPWEQILQELAQETAYRAASGTGAAAFGGTTADTPKFLQTIFGNLGLGSVPGSTGTSTLPGVPSAIKKAAAGGSASKTNVPSSSGTTGGP